MEKHFHKI